MVQWVRLNFQATIIIKKKNTSEVVFLFQGQKGEAGPPGLPGTVSTSGICYLCEVV